MLIKIEHYGNTFTAEISEDSDLCEVMDAFNGLLVCCTYHPESINDYILEKAAEIEGVDLDVEEGYHEN